MNLKNIFSTLAFATLTILFLILCTYNINVSRFTDWDESRHIVSALQMLEDGNYIVNKWVSSVDMWNLKPPISFWSLVISSKFFGNSLITMRVPSIISGMVLFILCSYILKTKYNKIASIVFMLLMLSCGRLITNHSFRTADPDAIYLLLIVSAVVTLSLGHSTKKISTAALLVSLAFLTKSWHASSIGFAFITAYLYQLKEKELNIKSFIYPAICIFTPIVIWLIARYQYDGFEFIKKMIDYDLLHRSSTQIEGHITSKWFYFDILYTNYWLLLYAFASSFAVSIYSNGIKKTFTYDVNILIVSIFTLFMFFTLAQTRLSWYGHPHTLLMCYATALLYGKSKKSWVIVLFLIFPASTLQLNASLKEISSYKLPDLYYQLSMINEKKDYPINISSKVSQSERATLMVYGGFSQPQIITTSKDKYYYLLEKKENLLNKKDLNCKLLSSGQKENIFICDN